MFLSCSIDVVKISRYYSVKNVIKKLCSRVSLVYIKYRYAYIEYLEYMYATLCSQVVRHAQGQLQTQQSQQQITNTSQAIQVVNHAKTPTNSQPTVIQPAQGGQQFIVTSKYRCMPV